MNISLHLPLAAWGYLTRRLSFVLLSALISEASASILSPIFSRHERSQPYLRVCLPSPLRFSPPPIPPEVAARTLVMPPPNQGEALEAISAINKESVAPETLPTPQIPPPRPAAPEPASVTIPPAPQPTTAQPLTIIPDDTPRAIHPEDLLPYFRAPAAPIITLPVSSATYQQQ